MRFSCGGSSAFMVTSDREDNSFGGRISVCSRYQNPITSGEQGRGRANSMRGLKDKVVVVAGGATGIGAATALRVSEEGASVVIGDVNLSVGQALAGKIA